MNEKNSVVKKHNKLIEGYVSYMDVRELRLLAQTAARITIKDKEFHTYQIPVKSISETNKNIFDEIVDVCNKLLDRKIKFVGETKTKKRTFKGYSLVTKCAYVEGKGFVEIQIHPDLKPYFLDLKNNFTQFKIDTLMRIPSTYSYRLYELLKQHHQGGMKYRDFEITELQEKLNINASHAPSYRAWGNFKDKVLTPAKKHFKQHTDLVFEFKAWAEYGRKFTHIRFTIRKNPGYQQMSLPGMEKKRSMNKNALVGDENTDQGG